MSSRLSSIIANANANSNTNSNANANANANTNSNADGNMKMKKSVSFTVANEPNNISNINVKEINNEIYDTSKILKSSIIK